MAKAPFSKQLEQLFVARTPLIFAESSEWQRVQGALLTAVNDESIKTGEERRVILKRGKFSPLEAYDYQLEKWTRDHEHLKQKPQGTAFLTKLLGFEIQQNFRFVYCLMTCKVQILG